MNQKILADLLAARSVKDCLRPFIKVRFPALTFRERTYFPSLERSFWGLYPPGPGTSVAA